jgi:phosphotransferase system enzyme I (PtsI)
MKVLTGIASSPGVAFGPVFRIRERKREVIKRTVDADLLEREKERFSSAMEAAERQLTAIVEDLRQKGLENEAGIIEGQWMVLADPQLSDDVCSRIEQESVNAEWAVSVTFDAYAAMFAQMEDDYLRDRVNDLKDVESRLIGLLQGDTDHPLSDLRGPSIIVAHDLTPSLTSQLDKRFVLGFATEIGSRTSHSSILARTMGIPAVVGCSGLLQEVADGDFVIVDGDEGSLTVNPDEQTRRKLEGKRAEMLRDAEIDRELADKPGVTADGARIDLMCNIGRPSDAQFVHEYGGEGVGLFRTEFLFMDRSSWPDEEEQFAAYRETVEALRGKPVIVRTLDIGGDKSLDYVRFPEEMNPFLGWRALRFCLGEPELFRTQLRAILRAGAYGPVSIMFPMVSGLAELQAAKEQLRIAREELQARGQSYGRQMPVGIMIEVPSAALIADQLAPHVDFFSIGTNDLIQYTIAVDRMNEKVSHLYDPGHTAVLRLIKMVCDAAARYGKGVGMCGEMAGEPEFTELLVGLGVTKLSMSPPMVPKVKRALLKIQRTQAEQRALERIR